MVMSIDLSRASHTVAFDSTFRVGTALTYRIPCLSNRKQDKVSEVTEINLSYIFNVQVERNDFEPMLTPPPPPHLYHFRPD